MVKAAIKQFFSRKNAFLLKMLLTIIVLVCIPLICIQLWIIRQSTAEFHSSNAGSYISALQANANTYSMQLRILSDTALRISQDSAIAAPLQENNSIYQLLTAVNQLNTFKASTPFISDVAVYYRTEDTVLSASCKRTLVTFCSHVAGTDSAAAAQLYGILDTVSTNTYSAKFDSTGYLLIARPVSILSMARQDAVICFLIKTSELSGIFDVSMPSNTSLSIVNPNGELVLYGSNFPAGLTENGDFREFLADVDKNTCTLTYGDESLNLYKYTDSASQNTMLACVGSDDAEKPVLRYVNRLHVTVIIALVFTCILLGTTVYVNYRPVKRLVTRHASDRNDKNLSELELLDSVFFAKDEQITNQKNLLSAFLISDLLFGVEIDQELLKLHFPATAYRQFAVAAVSQVQLSSAQANAIAGLLRSQISPAELYTTSLPNSPRTLFIFMSGEQLDRAMLKDKLMFAVRKIAGEPCTIHLGETVETVQELPKSHQSALAGDQAVAQPESIPNEDPYLTKEIQLFIQYVCLGDKEKALSALEKVEEIIASTNVKTNYQTYYCYKLLFSYLSGVKDNSTVLTERALEQLLAFRTPVQMFAQMRQIVIQHCDKLQKTTQSSNEQLQDKLLQYVNDNLTSSELCLTSAADHLNLSIYAVSRLFKECTMQNFKEYITRKRLDMAFDLLCTTDQNVSEIANAVGFEDASYFSEVFKKHYGVVPTKVRSAARSKNKDK